MPSLDNPSSDSPDAAGFRKSGSADWEAGSITSDATTMVRPGVASPQSNVVSPDATDRVPQSVIERGREGVVDDFDAFVRATAPSLTRSARRVQAPGTFRWRHCA